jgi:hypothetical protein
MRGRWCAPRQQPRTPPSAPTRGPVPPPPPSPLPSYQLPTTFSDANFFGFPITAVAWGLDWLFPNSESATAATHVMENPSNRRPEYKENHKSRSRSSVIVDHLVTLYMYDHGPATHTKRMEMFLFFSRGISCHSFAKNSPCVLLRTRLTHV